MAQINPHAPHHQDLQSHSPTTTGNDASLLASAERRFSSGPSGSWAFTQSQQLQASPLPAGDGSFWSTRASGLGIRGENSPLPPLRSAENSRLMWPESTWGRWPSKRVQGDPEPGRTCQSFRCNPTLGPGSPHPLPHSFLPSGF